MASPTQRVVALCLREAAAAFFPLELDAVRFSAACRTRSVLERSP
jgi:hypothetical protein